MTIAVEGVAVGAAMIPVIVGGVIGAGVGTMLLYGGAIEAGEAENIFEEPAEAPKEVKAHSPYEPLQKQQLKLTARPSRGFAAMFS
ncbi:hypothetical protein HYH03_009730 [Edaphochlamys debaryana]|uniref:Uncharacterized protein n=1 Tax=Edaphochlamys debaryana TaxID=47281 RepID=A0A835XY14_9CHLO|nr:hypothetical protein HYH03_009730 [Edaphochlamys debaryana]|eukprot:KAG2492000.1 hypothetical protein HYH03_009730 [Edaphochlamys debaryana]